MSALEDHAGDVLTKAAAGLGISQAELAVRADCSVADLRDFLSDVENARPVSAPLACRLAAAVGLDAEAYANLARAGYAPDVRLPDWIVCVPGRYGGMIVNAWVIRPPGWACAVVVDAGTDAEGVIRATDSLACKPAALLITHDHGDHVAAMEQLRAQFPAMSVFSSAGDEINNTRVLAPGDLVPGLPGAVRVLATRGHTDGSVSYFFDELPMPVCAVGDALFAGSIGGPRYSYEVALADLAASLLPLPDATLVLPGHGPPTTIGLEKSWNPFLVALRTNVQASL